MLLALLALLALLIQPWPPYSPPNDIEVKSLREARLVLASTLSLPSHEGCCRGRDIKIIARVIPALQTFGDRT